MTAWTLRNRFMNCVGIIYPCVTFCYWPVPKLLNIKANGTRVKTAVPLNIPCSQFSGNIIIFFLYL